MWGQLVSLGGPCGQRTWARPPRPALLPYDEVEVGPSKHEQTQQCGDGPIGHWSKRVFQGAGGPQVPAALGGQEALWGQRGPVAAPWPAMPPTSHLSLGLTGRVN